MKVSIGQSEKLNRSEKRMKVEKIGAFVVIPTVIIYKHSVCLNWMHYEISF